MRNLRFLVILVLLLPLLWSCDDTTTDPNTCATPIFAPAAGAYTTAQTVTITCATEGATIRFTGDGSEPTEASTAYTVPIVVATDMTLKAKAYKAGFSASLTATAEYMISRVATPVITPAGGTFTTAQTVTITCATAGAAIHYTTDGTEPDSAAKTLYTAPFTLTANAVVKAKAFKVGWDPSVTSSETYVIYDQMVSIPAGTYTMGRTTGNGYADELPTHSVALNAFYIGKYEVKQSEWFAVMGTNPSTFTGDNSRPVEEVSYYAVLVYCNKRSMNDGLVPAYSINGSTNPANWGAIPTSNNATWNAVACNWSATGYRLPTEAEWEYAARGGVNNPDYLYSGSDTIGDVAWYTSNAGNATHTVGTKTANGKGLFDMSGNVQEWVWDWYGSTYYGSSPSSNPTGPSTGTVHVIRGGSWDQAAGECRVAFRNWGSPEKGEDRVSNSRLGFRVVRMAN
jgi:formylglycine-generating enzyme required for sulfatase activity